jgi:hypothetical protein
MSPDAMSSQRKLKEEFGIDEYDLVCFHGEAGCCHPCPVELVDAAHVRAEIAALSNISLPNAPRGEEGEVRRVIKRDSIWRKHESLKLARSFRDNDTNELSLHGDQRGLKVWLLSSRHVLPFFLCDSWLRGVLKQAWNDISRPRRLYFG